MPSAHNHPLAARMYGDPTFVFRIKDDGGRKDLDFRGKSSEPTGISAAVLAAKTGALGPAGKRDRVQ
jgi:hypothetical protein